MNETSYQDNEQFTSEVEEADEVSEGIAIVGMSGRFPGARDLDEFWGNLAAGVESITFFSDEELLESGVDPESLRHPDYVKARGYLPEVEMFDAAFFGYSPREAALIDPQHRLFLEHSWSALEDAGYDPAKHDGSIGVYGGMRFPGYLFTNLMPNPDVIRRSGPLHVLVHNDKDFLASTVAYKLDLSGPAMTVQTACSTSLVAVSLACQSLMNYQCDMALAGGVAVSTPVKSGYRAGESLFSTDGHCRAFDAAASGTVGGNGVGIVVLKRLEEALEEGDTIRGVIKGFSVNNDGASKVGFFAPSVQGQSEAIALAQAMADVDPETVTYIEAHGTGTQLGDPVEIDALSRVFAASTDRKGFCALGSIKTNIGHLDAAAGVAGLIKTVLALEHAQIPPSLHYERPNPNIRFEETPFYVNTTLRNWPSTGVARRAGVSSFGLGGVNAHVVVEEAPAAKEGSPSRPYQLIPVSGRTLNTLETATADLAEFLENHPEVDLADVAHTRQVGRRAYRYRRAAVCRDRDEAVAALRGRDPRRVWSGEGEDRRRPVAFLFPGLGSNYVEMGLDLYQNEPAFREEMDRCCHGLEPHLGLDLREIIYPRGTDVPVGGSDGGQAQLDLKEMLKRGGDQGSDQPIRRTRFAQPAQFVIDYALAKLWMEWGVEPQALAGYSIGEYVAACLAGVVTVEEALLIVARRAALIDELPPGAMLAVALPEDDLRPLVEEPISLAALNGPSMGVLAGPVAAVDELEARLATEGVSCRRLATTHAFHSTMMEPMARRFGEVLEGVELKAPQVPMLSNVTGTWMQPEEVTDPAYWTRHLLSTVRFSDILEELWNEPGRILLEVGPGQNLGPMALQHPASEKVEDAVVLASLRGEFDSQSDVSFVLSSLARLWLAGLEIDWAGFSQHERRCRVPLPATPFERQRCWIDAPSRRHEEPAAVVDEIPESRASREPEAAAAHRQHSPRRLKNAQIAPRNETEATLVDIWKDILQVEDVGVYDDFSDLGGDSVLKIQLISRVREAGLRITPRQIFGLQTIAELAAVAETTPFAAVEAEPVVGEVPLTPIQVDFFEQAWIRPHLLNKAFVFEVGERQPPGLFHRLVQRLVVHHDCLRMRFQADSEGWRQFNGPSDGPVPFICVDLSALPRRQQTAALDRSMEELRCTLDISERLFCGALIESGGDRPAQFLMMAHFLVVDAVSWRILIEDAVALCDQLGRGEEPALPAKTTSFRSWALRLSQYAADHSFAEEWQYWLDERWRKAPSLHREAAGANTWASARNVVIELDVDDTAALLKDAPRAFNVQVDAVLLAPCVRAFASWNKAESLWLAYEGHGRMPVFGDFDVSRTVGWFTMLFPMLLTLPDQDGHWEGDLSAVQEQFSRAMQYAPSYGVLRYCKDNGNENDLILKSLPSPEVSFVYFGRFRQGNDKRSQTHLTLSQLAKSPTMMRAEQRRYLIDISAMTLGGKLRVNFSYCENIHHRETIERLAESYRKELVSIARETDRVLPPAER